MTITREMRLRSVVLREGQHAPMQVMHPLAVQLSKEGELCVCFDHVGTEIALTSRIESIRLSLSGFCPEVVLVDSGWVKTECGPDRVFALFRGDAVIRFTDAPWHPANCKGGKEHYRLVEMVQRGRPFTAVYEFVDQPNHREDGPGTLRQALSNVVEGASWSVVRRDWPLEMFNGRCRIDIRVEPKLSEGGAS